MAIFHHTTQVIGRSSGRSVVACAAYRSGETLHDDRIGTTFRLGMADRVLRTEIIAPAGTPSWALDRSQLWNRVEAGERRKDAQLAREVEIALPDELDHAAHVAIVREYIARALTPAGVVVDVAFHRSHRKDRPANPHIHVMETMRTVVGEGFGPKLRALNGNDEVVRRRAIWAEIVNAALAAAGHDARIDHRSHAERGIVYEPTQKEGPGARGRADRGQVSDRVAENVAIRRRNARLAERIAAARHRSSRPSSRTRPKEKPHAARVAVRSNGCVLDAPRPGPVARQHRAGGPGARRDGLFRLPGVGMADRRRADAALPVRVRPVADVHVGRGAAGQRPDRAGVLDPRGRPQRQPGRLAAQAAALTHPTGPFPHDAPHGIAAQAEALPQPIKAKVISKGPLPIQRLAGPQTGRDGR